MSAPGPLKNDSEKAFAPANGNATKTVLPACPNPTGNEIPIVSVRQSASFYARLCQPEASGRGGLGGDASRKFVISVESPSLLMVLLARTPSRYTTGEDGFVPLQSTCTSPDGTSNRPLCAKIGKTSAQCDLNEISSAMPGFIPPCRKMLDNDGGNFYTIAK